ncbi:hypothetical protein RIF29_15792 [Crotalaria pallida]|uniref:Uncharacterized protein n=1 Tax=Crotalaria pallida TaxID=3830 RepID=A0AAN9FJR1_CROPI
MSWSSFSSSCAVTVIVVDTATPSPIFYLFAFLVLSLFADRHRRRPSCGHLLLHLISFYVSRSSSAPCYLSVVRSSSSLGLSPQNAIHRTPMPPRTKLLSHTRRIKGQDICGDVLCSTFATPDAVDTANLSDQRQREVKSNVDHRQRQGHQIANRGPRILRPPSP